MKFLQRLKNLFLPEGKISDGFHSFDELYHYRMLYNAAFFNSLEGKYEVHKSYRHAEKSKKEPWRTGDITGINKDCPLALHIKPNTRTLKDGTMYCFMDKALGIELGLWK